MLFSENDFNKRLSRAVKATEWKENSRMGNFISFKQFLEYDSKSGVFDFVILFKILSRTIEMRTQLQPN